MIAIIIIIVLCLLYAFVKNYKENFALINIKMKNIEEKISSLLIKRRELIKDSEKIIKDVIKTDKNVYEGLADLNEQSISMTQFDKRLLAYINEFYLIESKYKKLNKNEEFKKIYLSVKDSDNELNAYKNYYNDTTVKYNKLIKNFPINIISVIKRRKEKEFFDTNEKHE